MDEENPKEKPAVNEIVPWYPQTRLAGLTLEQRYEEALVHGREVLRLNPDHPMAHTHLGILLKKQGKIEEAIQHFSEAVRLKPEDPVANKNLQEALAERHP